MCMIIGQVKNMCYQKFSFFCPMQDLDKIVTEVLKITANVGEYMRNEIDKVESAQIEEKEMNSLVSYVDKTSEKLIVKALSLLIPEAGYITEEKTIKTENKEYMWIIDPLDGTTNYLFGIPHYSTSIALQLNGEIILGIVSDNAKQEYFHAIKGKGAFRNGRKISLASKRKLTLANSIFVTGFPYRNDYDASAFFDVIDYWLKHSRGVRRLGSAALDLCYVACGRINCYYESFLNIWDLAAGDLIVKEAQGISSDFSGENNQLHSGQIIACDPRIYDEVLSLIKENLT